jgi:hypothetical protein
LRRVDAGGRGVKPAGSLSTHAVAQPANADGAPRTDDTLIRITEDVMFHRDVLRPVAPRAGSTAGTQAARVQLSLDLDDEA